MCCSTFTIYSRFESRRLESAQLSKLAGATPLRSAPRSRPHSGCAWLGLKSRGSLPHALARPHLWRDLPFPAHTAVLRAGIERWPNAMS